LAPPELAPLLQVRALSKAFGRTEALKEVSLDARGGEVHAVLGENGAGKSTLMKLLAGALQPDRGDVQLGGEPYLVRDTFAARLCGMAIVYQEPQLCPHLTVAENIVLGCEPLRFGLVDFGRARSLAAAALKRLLGDQGGIEPVARR